MVCHPKGIVGDTSSGRACGISKTLWMFRYTLNTSKNKSMCFGRSVLVLRFMFMLSTRMLLVDRNSIAYVDMPQCATFASYKAIQSTGCMMSFT